jgi:type I restriction enzyme, S subunit
LARPGERRRVKLGDVARTASASARRDDENFIERIVGLDHIDARSLEIQRWGGLEDGTSFTRTFREGHVLFGRRRAYQRKVAVAEFGGICSGDIYVLEAKDGLLDELLPFVIESDLFFAHALATSAGSLSPRTKWKDLAELEFELPSEEEQRELAETLWANERCLRAARHLLAHVQDLGAAAFDQATAATPAGVLGDVLDDIEAGKSPAAAGRPAEDGEYGVLKVSAVGDGIYVPSENKALLVSTDFEARSEVRPGDVLVSRANAAVTGVGRPCVVTDTPEGLMLSDKTLRLVADEEKVDKTYLLAALRSRRYRAYIRSAASGTDAKNISQAKLRRAPLPVPPIDEQRDVVRSLAPIDEVNGAAERYRNQLEQMRAALTAAIFEETA